MLDKRNLMILAIVFMARGTGTTSLRNYGTLPPTTTSTESTTTINPTTTTIALAFTLTKTLNSTTITPDSSTIQSQISTPTDATDTPTTTTNLTTRPTIPTPKSSTIKTLTTMESNNTSTSTNDSTAMKPTTTTTTITTTTAALESTSTKTPNTSAIMPEPTTNQSLTITTPTLATTGNPTTTGTTNAPSSYSPPIDSLSLKVAMSVSINKTFKNTLKHSESDDYKEMESKFKTQLSQMYENTTGFLYVRIDGFSEGSIHCHYEAVFEASIDLKVVVQETKQNTFEIDGYQANMASAIEMIEKVAEDITSGLLCNIMKNACSPGYACVSVDGYIACLHYCLYDPPKCGLHGDCYYDSSSESTKCRCTETDDAIYGGPNCNNKIEKLSMSSTAIISIAAGCGGVMAAISVSVIVCLVIRNRSLKKGLKNRESFTELDREGILMKRLVSSQQLERHQNVLMGGNDRRDMYDHNPRAHGSLASIYGGDDGGRSVDSRIGNVEGYMYIHPQGSEEHHPGAGTYIDLHSTNRDSQSVVSSVYDQIDTTTKFAIRRPQITPRPDYF